MGQLDNIMNSKNGIKVQEHLAMDIKLVFEQDDDIKIYVQGKYISRSV